MVEGNRKSCDQASRSDNRLHMIQFCGIYYNYVCMLINLCQMVKNLVHTNSSAAKVGPPLLGGLYHFLTGTRDNCDSEAKSMREKFLEPEETPLVKVAGRHQKKKVK